MNREIFFRGKTEEGKWLYGSLERRENVDYIGGYEITRPTVNDPCGDTIWITEKVVSDTVGEFTGLKDNNDKGIFEGDILKFAETNYTYEVRFENAGFVCYHHTNKEFGRWGSLGRIKDHDFSKYKITVMGNIHENKTA